MCEENSSSAHVRRKLNALCAWNLSIQKNNKKLTFACVWFSMVTKPILNFN
jgi:hypothetical protein